MTLVSSFWILPSAIVSSHAVELVCVSRLLIGWRQGPLGCAWRTGNSQGQHQERSGSLLLILHLDALQLQGSRSA